MADSRSVRFSEQDLQMFSSASGDTNPLHLSSAFASRTAYGQQVVFGALGCIACLASVDEGPGTVKRLVADFQRPIFLHIDYRVEASESRDGMVVRLFDGSIPIVTTTVKFTPENRPESLLPANAEFPRSAARLLAWEDLALGAEVSGSYRSCAGAMQDLYDRWSLKLDPMVVEALLWSSYFIGMEIPGQNALFFRAVLEFHGTVKPERPLCFKTNIVSLNQSLAQVRTAIELSDDDRPIVSGQLTSFVRPQMPELRFSEGEEPASDANAMAGKVAMVLGASRGLGAAIALTLAVAGCQVIAVSRSRAHWRSDLSDTLSSRLTFWEADVGDAQALTELNARAGDSLGRIDFLICSAFPAIAPFRLEPSATVRIQQYLKRATEMVLHPLTAFLPQLSRANGCTVLISSVAVEEPVRDWPHYVAAKSSAEALCRVAVMQFPETSLLIVRPERLLTELTNTPMGRQGAASPLSVARQISERMQRPLAPGTCEVFNPARGLS